LGDRESANIAELETKKYRTIFSELNRSNLFLSVFSPGALSDFGEFLAREYPDLFDKNLILIIGNS
jgi:hypothetical protein